MPSENLSELGTTLAIHIDIGNPKYRNAAEQLLRRRDTFEPEANITNAVRDFLILTGLARSEENPPSEASRRAVDLTALDTFIEFKRRIGTAPDGEPDPENLSRDSIPVPRFRRSRAGDYTRNSFRAELAGSYSQTTNAQSRGNRESRELLSECVSCITSEPSEFIV